MFNEKIIKIILDDIFSIITVNKNSYQTLVRCILIRMEIHLKENNALQTFEGLKKDIDDFLDSNKKACVYNYSMFFKKFKRENLRESDLVHSKYRKLIYIISNYVLSFKEKQKNDLKEKCSNKNITVTTYYSNLPTKGKRVSDKKAYEWNLKIIKRKR